jgi:L-rhamnose isomerase
VLQVLQAVKAAGLRLEALNLRFPPTFAAGAFANADAALRAAAVQLAVDGCRKAAALGADQLVVWPQYDGYDLHFQVDYAAAWQHSVEAFGAVAAACPPGVRVALEFKPTDAQARFGLVASTAAALLLVQEVGAPNLGLALDLGHLLMAGENPAQSVAMAARAGRLFGVHLNDAHARLGAEDGLPFASVNPRAALEVVLQLQAAQYNASVYFDTFPGTLDPVAEAALNIRTFKQLWCRAAVLRARMQQRQRQQDALGALQLLLDEQASVPGCADWADEAAWRAFERRERERKVWWWRWSEHD